MKSKTSYTLYPLVFLIVAGSVMITFIGWIIIKSNMDDLYRPDIIFGALFVIWLGLFPLIMIVQHLCGIEIKDDHVVIKYVFGLISSRYNFNRLKQAQYFFFNEGVIIETDSGKQITIGQKQYQNYAQLRDLIDKYIERSDKLRPRYWSKTLIILTLIGGIILTGLIISI